MLLEEQLWPGRSRVQFSIWWFVLSTKYPVGDVLKADRFMRSNFGNEVWAGKNGYNHGPIEGISSYDNDLVYQESEWILTIDYHQGLNPMVLWF